MGTARRDWTTGAGVAALLVLHVALALGAVAGKSVTSDEILHVTGGYFYDRFGDFRLHPENGNLPQRWAALPASRWAPPPPLADNIHWRTSDSAVIAYALFYETGHDHWPMLMAGRCLMTIFSVGTGLLVFGWARFLAGPAAGFLALTLYALDPNVLAHAPLATSDSAAVFFLLASVTAFWVHLRDPARPAGWLSLPVFGLACVAKYSAVLLLPMFLLLLAWRIAREAPAQRRRWWRLAPLTLAGHCLAAWGVIWLFFGFRYSGFAPGLPPADHYIAPWPRVEAYLGWQTAVVKLLRDWRALPEAFLFGYSWTIVSAQQRAAFLAGEYGFSGWASFFPLAFGWKSTLPLLTALAVMAVALARRWRRAAGRALDFAAAAPLLVLFVIYGAFSVTSHLNIGHRHILPLYPPLFCLAGAVAAAGMLADRFRRVLVPVLVAGAVATNAAIAPDYLAYFNPIAGGPARGWRLLVDSSLDWGQDLPALKSWLERNNPGPAPQPVFLSYFGSGEPDYYGLRATRLPFVNGFKRIHPWSEPRGGIYCVSATMLQEVYSPVGHDFPPALEHEYQSLKALGPLFHAYWQGPESRAEALRALPEENLRAAWVRYDWLRFTRLATYLRQRRPDATIGYSILVHRLPDAEIDEVLNRRYSDWANAIGRAAAEADQ